MNSKTPANERIVLTDTETEIVGDYYENPYNCNVCGDFLGFGIGSLSDAEDDAVKLICQPCMALARLRIRFWREQEH